MKTKLFFFKLLFLYFILGAHSQQLITKKEIIKDVDFFFKTIYRVHPNPFTIKSKNKINNIIDSFYSEIPAKIAIKEYYKKLIIYFNPLFDSHTGIIPVDEKNHFSMGNLDGNCFPYKIVINNNSFSIPEIYDNDSVLLISINNINCTEIIKIVLSYYHIETKNYQFQIENFYFPFLFKYFFGNSDKFKLSYKTKNYTFDTTIFAININEYLKKYNLINNLDLFKFDYFPLLDAGIIYLNSFSFNNKQSDEYNTFLKETFKFIKEKKINYLFIDIKNNDGGNDQPVYTLLNYIIKKNSLIEIGNYCFKNSIDFKRNIRNMYAMKEIRYEKKIRQKIQFFRLFHIFGIKSIHHKKNINFIQKEPYYFTGNVILIIGHKTASAAMTLHNIFKLNKLGISIGQPTLNSTNLYANSLIYQMPKSKIPFRCATLYYDYPDKNISVTKNSAQPDHLIQFEFNKNLFTEKEIAKILKTISIKNIDH